LTVLGISRRIQPRQRGGSRRRGIGRGQRRRQSRYVLDGPLMADEAEQVCTGWSINGRWQRRRQSRYVLDGPLMDKF